MKLVKLADERDKKDYGANSLVSDIKRMHDEEGIEMMAVIYKKSDGSYGIGTTSGNNAEFIGLIELAKLQYMDEV